jgi:hypothetical protein
VTRKNSTLNIKSPTFATRCQAQKQEHLCQENTCLGNAQNPCSLHSIGSVFILLEIVHRPRDSVCGEEATRVLTLVGRATLEYSEKLDCRSIRLLDLKPGSGEEIIHFELGTHSLDNLPDYIALSYTWGDPLDTVSVLGDGKIVKVTRTLKNALWQLREDRKGLLRQKYPGVRRSQSLRFWIEAICINQLDREEKSFQVGLRYVTYSTLPSMEFSPNQQGQSTVALPTPRLIKTSSATPMQPNSTLEDFHLPL